MVYICVDRDFARSKNFLVLPQHYDCQFETELSVAQFQIDNHTLIFTLIIHIWSLNHYSDYSL